MREKEYYEKGKFTNVDVEVTTIEPWKTKGKEKAFREDIWERLQMTNKTKEKPN